MPQDMAEKLASNMLAPQDAPTTVNVLKALLKDDYMLSVAQREVELRTKARRGLFS
jgi:hypothetical protein